MENTEKGVHDGSAVTGETQVADAAAERRLLWKLDTHVVPMLAVFYMLAFLDRINIGNARIQGMDRDLQLSVENRFNVASFLVYPLYVVLEVPSNIVMKHVRPSLWLAFLMFGFGIITLCTGFVQSYGSLYALRFLLGGFEAGTLPGISYILSMYYKRHELSKRITMIYVALGVAGAFGGLLAYAIAHLDGQRGYAGWRWIYIIEGAATVVIALISPFFIADWPDQQKFLTPAEKDLLQRRITEDASPYPMERLDWASARLILLDWKIWLGSLIYMGTSVTILSLSFFLPTILVQFGWMATQAQIHTIPIYIVMMVVGLIAGAASDWLKHRYAFLLGGTLVVTAGYAMLLNGSHLSREAQYGAIFLLTAGNFLCGPLAVSWLANNVSGTWKRALASSLQISIGNVGGIIGSFIYLDREKPFFKTGYGVGLGMQWMCAVAATVLLIGLMVENRRRRRGDRDERLSWEKEKVDNIGDYHPHFRYVY